MALFVKVCGFIGAWLFFVGPVYQSVQELREEARALEEHRGPWKELEPEKRSSAWWWLLPPVKVVLAWRERAQQRKRLLASLTPSEMSAVVALIKKAEGWLLVAGGGLLAAIKETHQVVVDLSAPLWVLWATVALMVLLAGSYAAAGAAQREKFARLREQTKTP
jgi:hypothetical protein